MISSMVRSARRRLQAGLALTASSVVTRLNGRLHVRRSAFRSAVRARSCGSVAARHPAAQTFAQARWVDRHAGSLQLIGQLAAAPPLVMQRQQSFAQWLQHVGGSLALPRRLPFRQLREFLFQRRVVQCRGQLRVINRCSHDRFHGLIFDRCSSSEHSPTRAVTRRPAGSRTASARQSAIRPHVVHRAARPAAAGRLRHRLEAGLVSYPTASFSWHTRPSQSVRICEQSFRRFQLPLVA